jgi:hypothetical protein
MIFQVTLCNFWYKGYSQHNTQHIQKLAAEDMKILRYNRSKFVIFLFFMQKLLGKSIVVLCNICRVFLQESNKLEFAFF